MSSHLEDFKLIVEKFQVSEGKAVVIYRAGHKLIFKVFNYIEGRPKGPVPVNFGIVVFPGFQALDAFGPLDALHTLSVMFPMKLAILSESLDAVSTKLNPISSAIGSDFGQSINPTHTFASPPPLDVLLVPGGVGAMHPDIRTAIEFVGKIY
ncbi:hypothetical protein H0H92_015031 [Tricholoma furcatifolium]|nr:hypothetical protein H0H92_015031 [Tricholoma furcatifolium]